MNTNVDQTASQYERIGSEVGVHNLVRRFYQLMDELPEVSGIRALHGASLDGAQEKLFMFLSGWLGGPPLYLEKHGHPRLRMRHFPFPISESERDQWMLCMNRAMFETVADVALRDELSAALYKIADFMRNAE
ncbi:MAG: globin [Zetaproteobacteria bacterium CG_4_9_14_3_um_filter_49_83]|nr:MAG: globin [Zetaproteobacteria bacterium CG1_02_49_23]PIQ30334.1 MAG: globin [Zetaproteobacteria bacterium CG17_big_fil_post_rev_8_21_14_2_50_50_13]PIV29575.1 MAG: globin [Zetaproteobacteria bacterium CG02_land_8_20_14_3_00_50_9]PIY56508.1 MAG: globin [Zetaproteobacteria bacterium CG_4_10_14_0_8_um_filter_49_80]PJA33854.1 MAG: globin [Zetaproteobacteria bacterium CG_4_9_14_3_um_filter_49_83]